MDVDQLILAHTEMAERIGMKYAHQNSKYQPECVAEAYCLVVDFFKEHYTLYETAGENYKRVLGTFIKRSLGDYFQVWRTPKQLGIIDDSGYMPDTEMLDYLSGLFGNDADALIVFKMFQTGLGYEDISDLAPHLRTAIWQMRTAHANERRRREDALAVASGEQAVHSEEGVPEAVEAVEGTSLNH